MRPLDQQKGAPARSQGRVREGVFDEREVLAARPPPASSWRSRRPVRQSIVCAGVARQHRSAYPAPLTRPHPVLPSDGTNVLVFFFCPAHLGGFSLGLSLFAQSPIRGVRQKTPKQGAFPDTSVGCWPNACGFVRILSYTHTSPARRDEKGIPTHPKGKNGTNTPARTQHALPGRNPHANQTPKPIACYIVHFPRSSLAFPPFVTGDRGEVLWVGIVLGDGRK
ncbi:uncharacterized protein EV422DRAFT_528433 [Fimicolochytrium jonesii]|uniref:uncharacterized protein n=1 Tax=Fimicolochytrium jonesii TaxID=1396493 RepID=UPI0022FEC07C|nr:uncharacterized protein EV422DRAFT_528433 [Fimicolochytrium jonesii]KAI8821527.1 hypothetical protein EV422DRAFT_528433 [Fimicolochytrium jonesii]